MLASCPEPPLTQPTQPTHTLLVVPGIMTPGPSTASASASSSMRWLRRAVIAVIVLCVAFNVAARTSYADRLLTQRASAGRPWQQLLVGLSSSQEEDADGSYRVGGEDARPAAFDQCGRWQEAYMERHRKIVAGDLPPKYLVAVLHDAGVADQLLGAVTAFYWALVR